MQSNTQRWVKFRFTGSGGSTTGLVMPEDQFYATSIADLSRAFLPREMVTIGAKVIERSDPFETWEMAFAYRFPDEKK